MHRRKAFIAALTSSALLATTGIAPFSGAGALAAPIPATGVSALAFARFQGEVDGPETTSAATGVADASAEADAGPLPNQARSQAIAALPGSVGALATVFGAAAASDPDSLAATATARQFTNWIARSSDPGTTEVAIDVVAAFDGVLETISYAGQLIPGALMAGVTAEMAVHTAAGSEFVFFASALLDHHGPAVLPPNPSPGPLSVTGPWADAFTLDVTFLSRTAAVNYFEVLPDAFTVPVDTPFAWELALTVSVFAIAPVEIGATADFLHTGSFEFVAPEGVSLEQIVAVDPPTPPVGAPEPAALALFIVGLSGLALMGERAPRRRGES